MVVRKRNGSRAFQRRVLLRDHASYLRFKERSMTLGQDDVFAEGHVRVAFVSGGRARPIPKPLRTAVKADCVGVAFISR